MKKESKNLIAAMAYDIYDQWEKCKTARGADLDKESQRLNDACKAGQGITELANVQLKQLYATGFLPDENILIDKDETKLVNAKRSVEKKVPGSRGLLDEFVRQ